VSDINLNTQKIETRLYNIYLKFISAVGLSDGAIPGNFLVGQCSNSYAIGTDYNCMCLAGEHHRSQLSRGAVRPEREPNGKVYGCGLLMDANDKLSIFFTSNGILIGKFLLGKFGSEVSEKTAKYF
jgi:hypothetical protein